MKYFSQKLGLIESDRPTRLKMLRAQTTALSKQVPLLYFIICIDAATLSYTHIGKAPWALSVLVPGVLIFVCLLRMSIWISRKQNYEITQEIAKRRLTTTTILAPVIGVLFMAWIIALYQYGDASMRDQVIATFAMSVIGCIYCLLHHPLAAMALAGFTVPSISLFLAFSGSSTLAAFGADLFIVVIGMCYMVLRSSQDFAQMIRSQVQAEHLGAENLRLANIDMLTELPNRRRFFDKLQDAFERNRASGRFYVGTIDLDGFKPVNDVFGHIVGDRVLVECASRFRAAAGEGVFIARLGGDEFGLIVENTPTNDDVIALGGRLCAAARAPFDLDGIVASISASIGFAAFPTAADKPQLLYERADYALYFAKRDLRGEAVLFSPEHEAQMKGVSNIEQHLRRADLEAEFSLNFQPLFRVNDNSILAFEALARWNSPELGNVSPVEFITVAERSELIHRLTRTLLHKALKAAALWPADVRLSFNLSARDLISPLAIAQIITIIERSGVAPHRIDFEVTETALMADFEQANESLYTLKRLGVQIALDDFGTGYSSLNYVHRLPLDKIKIDRSFVPEMQNSQSARDIVKTMIAMCGNLRLECVTEGIETQEQLDMLKEVGGMLAQGYHLGRPIPESEIVDFLAQTRSQAETRAIRQLA